MRVWILNWARKTDFRRQQILEALIDRLRRSYLERHCDVLRSLSVRVRELPGVDSGKALHEEGTRYQPGAVIHAFGLRSAATLAGHPSIAGSAEFSLIDQPDGSFRLDALGVLQTPQTCPHDPGPIRSAPIEAMSEAILGSTQQAATVALTDLLDRADPTGEAFVRIDDVPLVQRSHLYVARSLAEASIPVLVNAIPALLGPADAREWRDLRRTFPRLVTFGQHGWSHVDRHGEGIKQEFGQVRSYRQQREDIVRGRDRLQELLGVSVDVFCPPFNRYDLNTLRCLREEGFRVVTAGPETLNWSDLPRQLPAAVDPVRWLDGEPSQGTLNHLAGSVVLALRDERYAGFGIVLHPQKMTPELTEQVLGLVRRWSSLGVVRWVSPWNRPPE